MSAAAGLLRHPALYRAWQAPFADAKLAPLLRRGEIGAARRVLDVGCGPGTNTGHFAHADYLGVDAEPAYTSAAARRHGRRFVTADVRRLPPEVAGERFDFVLVNSLLHHLGDADAQGLLADLRGLVSPGGAVHVLDLVLPEGPSVARFLARHDRGSHARPLARWRELLGGVLAVEVFEPYLVGLFGVPLWRMLYCKGRTEP